MSQNANLLMWHASERVAAALRVSHWGKVYWNAASPSDKPGAGLVAMRKRGTRLCPPVKWSPNMAAKARRLMTKDGLNADDAAKGVGREPPDHVPSA
jgi:hypothetical protein